MNTLTDGLLLVSLIALFFISRCRERTLVRAASSLRESEAMFRQLGAHSLDAIIMANAEGRVTYWSSAAERMFGYSQAEIVGKNVHQILAPERYRGAANAGFSQFQTTGQGKAVGKVLELSALRKDGSEFPIELSVAAVPKGTSWRAIAIVREITERRMREEHLRVSMEALELRIRQQSFAVDFAKVRGDDFTSVDAMLQWLADALPAAYQYTAVACARVTLDGRSFAGAHFTASLVTHRAQIVINGKLRGQIEAGYVTEYHLPREDPLRRAEQTLLDETARDVSLFVRRIEAEEALRIADRIVENSSVVRYRARLEPNMPITYVSENIWKYGYRPDQIHSVADFCETLVHPDDLTTVKESQARLLSGRPPESFEFRLRKPDGSWRWIENLITVVPGDHGAPGAAEGVLIDITERKLAADRIRRRDRILDAIAQIALELLSSAAIDAVMPGLLRIVGEAVGADRVVVLENDEAPGGSPIVRERFAWNSPGLVHHVQPGAPPASPDAQKLLASLLRTLPKGEVFKAFPRTLQSEIGAFFRGLDVQSIVLVPIPDDLEPRGYVGIDDFHAEREWDQAECDALKVLAGMIGAAIDRAQRMSDLAEANRVVENSTTILYCLDAKPTLPLTYISANVTRWGYRRAQFTDSPDFYESLIHPEDLTRVREWGAALIEGRSAVTSSEIRIRIADGSYRWFDARISLARNDSGRISRIDGILMDITAKKEAEEQLEFFNLFLSAALESSADGVLATDRNGKPVSFNQRFLEIWGMAPESAGAAIDDVFLHAEASTLRDPQGFKERARYLNAHPEENSRGVIEFRDGRMFELDSHGLHDSRNQSLGRIWFFREASQPVNQRTDLRKMLVRAK